MREVANDEIKAWEGLCESLARPLVGRGNAELDDLVQEGRLYVWHRLRNGQTIHPDFIRYRMLNWVKFLTAQARGDDASYSDMMFDPNDWVAI